MGALSIAGDEEKSKEPLNICNISALLIEREVNMKVKSHYGQPPPLLWLAPSPPPSSTVVIAGSLFPHVTQKIHVLIPACMRHTILTASTN